MKKQLLKLGKILPMLLLWSGVSAQYCTPSYTTGCTSGDDIDDFVVLGGGINHLGSGCSANAYGDFTQDASLEGNFEMGLTYNFDATHNYPNQYLRIWIDFDNNDVFDPSEEVFASTTGSNNTVGSFTIPLTVSPTTTRMRVMGRWNSSPTDPCNPGGGFGETHDYTVNILPAPSCLPISDLGTIDILQTEVEVNWEDINNTNEFDVEYGAPGFTVGSGNEIGSQVATDTVTSITGLDPNTSYDIYVRADCGNDGQSNWFGPLTVTTACPTSLSAPFSENFDGPTWISGTGFANNDSEINQCWSRNPSANGTFLWGTRSGTTNNGNTGPSEDFSGSGNYVYTEGSNGSTGDTAVIITPSIDLSALTDPMLSYYYHMYGSDIDSLSVQVSSDNGATWNTEETITGEQQNDNTDPWNKSYVNLENYVNQTVLIRWLTTKGSSFNCDIAIDEVSIDEEPSCYDPQSLEFLSSNDEEIEIGWDEIGSATDWNIEYGLEGFTQGSGTVVNVSSNPATVTGLDDNTAYDFYVQSDCGSGNESNWIGPVQGITECGIFSAPFYENFNDSSWVSGTGFANNNSEVNQCWSRNPSANGTFLWGTRTGTTGTGSTGPSDDFTGGEKYVFTEGSNGSTGDTAVIISPTIDLSSLTDPMLSYYYHMYGDDIDSLSVQVSTDNGATWNTEATIIGEQQNDNTDPWKKSYVSLENYVNQTVLVRWFTTRGSSFNCDLAIDEVLIDEEPSCYDPQDIVYTGSSFDEITLEWNEIGSATDWNIEYGPEGFTQGSGTVVNVSSNPATVTGLDANTTYDFYVQADCGGGDLSNFFGTLTATTQCNPIATPFSENFDGGNWVSGTGFNNTGSEIDECWTRNPSTTANFHWGTREGTTGTGNSGPSDDFTGGGNYIFTEGNNGSTGDVAEIISPYIDLSGVTAPALSYHYHLYGANIDSLSVEISTDNGATWTKKQTIIGEQQNDNTDPWIETWVNLAAYAGATIQIKWSGPKGGINCDMAIDEVSVDEAPACFDPQNLEFVFASDEEITIEWTEIGSATNWNIEYGLEGYTQGNPIATVSVGSNPGTITGLDDNTTYDFYVQSNCGGGDESDWIGPISATTQCNAIGTPFSENFDNQSVWVSGSGFNNSGSEIDDCWSRNPATSSDFFWGTRSGTTATGSSGPSDDFTGGGNYIFTEGSNGSSGDIAEFISPLIDLSNLNVPALKYHYHLYGANIDSLSVQISSDNGSTWTTEQTIIGEQQSDNTDPWIETFINLAAYANETILIKWIGPKGSSFNCDMAIDEVSVEEAPSCFDPQNLALDATSSSSVTVSWNEIGSATNWNIEYGAPGFAPATGNQIGSLSTSNNPETITGLDDNTTYDVYIQSDCGGGDESDWIGPLTVTTDCGAFTAFYSQDFDGVSNPDVPACWTPIANGTSTAVRCRTITTNTPNSTPNQIEMYNSFTSGAAQDLMLVSPQFTDIDAGTNQIRFFAKRNNNTVDLEIGTMSDPNDPSTFTLFATIDSLTQSHEQYVIEFDNYTGTDEYISFRHANTATAQYIYIDDFVWEEIPPCPSPYNLDVANIGLTEAELSWTDPAGSDWDIEWGAAGFTQGNGTVVTTSNNPYLLTGLTQGTSYEFYVRADCGGSVSGNWIGPFEFETAIPGATCNAPLVVNTIPYTDNGNTIDFGNNYVAADRPATGGAQFSSGTGTNTYLSGYDVVYEFTPTVTGAYNIEASNVANDWVSLWLFNGCSPFTSTEAYHTATNGTTRLLPDIQLTAGTTYYVVISSWESNLESTPYDLFICLEEDASFTYPVTEICELENPFTPDMVETPGGTFSSTAGLAIDPSTGEIDPGQSTPGVYEVEYTTSTTLCGNTETFTIEIEGLEDASFTYPSSAACELGGTLSPNLTGLAGGTYTSTFGLEIDPGSGEIDLDNSLPGNYTVTYTSSLSPCASTETFDIEIQEAQDAQFGFQEDTYCLQDGTISPIVFGVEGGQFSAEIGLFISTSNGDINTSSSLAGTYWVYYESPGPDCPGLDSTQVTIQDCASLDVNDLGKIEVFPNPASDEVNYVLPDLSGNISITMMDATGKVVFSENVNGNIGQDQIDTRKFERGVYLIRFNTDFGSTTKRVVIAR